MTAAIGAMILAAGRGERMRPLSDTTPKPLLEAGGKPYRPQIQLARAGFGRSSSTPHTSGTVCQALGNGKARRIPRVVFRPRPLEVAGGIARCHCCHQDRR
jgi:MurNAc alpha-1-phosphate uridylyltransferase